MRLRHFAAILVFAAPLAGCGTFSNKQKAEDKKKAEEDARKDASKDPAFLAFLGRLRTAVGRRDYAMLQSMMAPDFGYRWDNPPPGDNVFTYWDLNNTWPEVERLLRQPFVPHGDYMVAPPELVTNPGVVTYRAGMRLVGGSWRFAYFVPPEPGPHAQ
jgi:hypothetical protein